MRKITKIRRSIRAISPVIAVLLMIAIAVVASLVAYAWVIGYIGGTTSKAGKAIDIPSYTSSTKGNLIVYVQNVGQGTVQLKQDGAVFVNDELKNILQSPSGTNLTTGQLIPISVGQTAELVIDCPYNPPQRIKIITVEGTSMQTTGNGNGNGNNNNPSSQYTITVGWVGDGSIVPRGPLVTVSPGATQSFTIVPGANSRIQDVSVDGLSEGIVVSRTFSNIDRNHIIFATFQLNAANTHTIIATAGPNGTISPSGQVTVQNNANQIFTFTANAGYHVSSIMVDGVSQTLASSYTFTSVTANHRIAVAFEADSGGTQAQHTITASATVGGTITPSGAVVVNNGLNQQFQIAANSGYHVADVRVDGASVGTPASFTFAAVTADHTIYAIFESDAVTPPGGPYTITATAGQGGSISPNGVISVANGGTQAFTIAPNSGYQIANIFVDNTPVGAVASYTFTNVLTSHTIFATFATASNYAITVGWVGDGSIVPRGPLVTVSPGATQSFTIVPGANSRIQDVSVDGLSEGIVVSRTFSNIDRNHIIFATFQLNAANTHTIIATAGPNGTISPSGQVTVQNNANQIFTFTANAGYHVSSIMVDGVSQTLASSYTFTSVTANHRIAVAFEADSGGTQAQHTITASATVGGTITPSGAVVVNNGLNQQFQIAANSGYHVADVRVDGASVGTPASFTFAAVTADHTIYAIFESDAVTPPGGPYTITATAGQGGSISPNGDTSVPSGGSQAYTITPNTGYQISNVFIDGNPVGAVASYTFSNVLASHTIFVTFALTTTTTHTIYASAGPNGQISPTGSVPVNFGADQAFTITPNNGYHIADVTVDGTSIGAALSYTFTNVDADHTIAASFAQNTAGSHTILATAGPNGIISPSGQVNVPNGNSQAFQIRPDSGYHIASIAVDGTPIANPQQAYTFTNVVSDHTIAAAFAADPVITHTITVLPVTNGQIAPGTGTVNDGTDKTYTITANTGYTVSDVTVDGNSLGSMISYTFVNVVMDHTIGATFTQITGSHHVIHASAGANGQITPEGDVIVNDRSDQTFNIVPDLHYHIALIMVDGASAGTGNSYTFTNVRADHTITVTFAINTFAITASANANGQITPSGTVQVNYGADQTFNIQPSTGYRVSNVVVDGTSVGSQTSYTFTNVTASHTIIASFAAIPQGTYTIQASTGGHGTISPSGSVVVNAGLDQAFTFTPDSHYHIDNVVVDGTSIGARTSYTFTNVISDHTIAVTFSIDTVTITATTGANGHITPIGAVAVPYGSNQLFTMTPNSGYIVASLTIDGSFAGYGTSYLFTNVVADHTIAVTFTTGTTLIQTGFDGSPWDASWQAGGNPPWYAAIGQGIGGTTAAKSDPVGSNDGPFTSDMMDTRGQNTIRITFMYMVLNTNSANDLRTAYSYNSATPDLGANSANFHYQTGIGLPAQGGVWYVGTLTITRTATAGAIQDANAFSQYFYFRFESSLSGSGGSAEQTWVDNVVITMSP